MTMACTCSFAEFCEEESENVPRQLIGAYRTAALMQDQREHVLVPRTLILPRDARLNLVSCDHHLQDTATPLAIPRQSRCRASRYEKFPRTASCQ